MASGWNLWVWLECIGVVSGCCKEVYRLPHNNVNSDNFALQIFGAFLTKISMINYLTIIFLRF